MRHGRAGDARTDALRQLTEAGRREVSAVARMVRTRGLEGVQVCSSPLIRARQTADLVSEEAGCGPVTELDALASGASLEGLLDLVHRHQRQPALLLVGHMPDLGVLAGFLAWGERGRVLDLAVGTVVSLTVEQVTPAPRASLEWILSPADTL